MSGQILKTAATSSTVMVIMAVAIDSLYSVIVGPIMIKRMLTIADAHAETETGHDRQLQNDSGLLVRNCCLGTSAMFLRNMQVARSDGFGPPLASNKVSKCRGMQADDAAHCQRS
eukprot:2342295-Amphidinium_carterae.3